MFGHIAVINSIHTGIVVRFCAMFQALLAEQESGTSTKGQTLTEQILQIMETILLEASAQPHDTYKVGFKVSLSKP